MHWERKDSLNTRIIGLNIKKYRKEKHLTQERLAEALDISTVHMSHIEGGSVSMSLDLLLRICETLGASPNQILEGSYAPPSSPERTSSSELLQGGLSPELRLLCCDMIELMKKARQTGPLKIRPIYPCLHPKISSALPPKNICAGPVPVL